MNQNQQRKEKLLMESRSKITFSFDDGFALDMKTATLLEKYGLRGVFYIVVDWVGKDGFLKWEQIKDLEARGHEIGSHTMTHPQDLKAKFDDQLFFEVKTSKDLLESALGHPVTKFCYPRGRYDERVLAAVEEAGYLEARITGKPGVIDVVNPLLVPGSVHVFQRPEYNGVKVFDYAKRTIDKVRNDGGRCEIWGHSNEIDRNFLWDTLEYILNYVKT